jgi:hypothetical protein
VNPHVGGPGNDGFNGSIFGDTAKMGAGDDFADGREGNDCLDGEGDKDNLVGWDGDDVLSGGRGIDTLVGGQGDDSLNGGDNNDRLEGGFGDDELNGVDGRDTILGQSGRDEIRGGNGNDNVDGSDGDDFLVDGGDNDDNVKGDSGNDRVSGGDGDDDVLGGTGDDDVSGGDDNDQVQGEGGNDVLDGGDGKDRMFGQAGRDRMTGGPKKDTLNGGAEDDWINGGPGNDLLQGEAAEDLMYGDEGDDELAGGTFQDNLYGGFGDDRIFGEAGSDNLWGERGDDKLYGGPGQDFLIGGVGEDDLYGGDGGDVIESADGRKETNIDCGPDFDILFADPEDKAVNCEQRRAGGYSTPYPEGVPVPVPGKVVLPDRDDKESREKRIRESYDIAFGRPPTDTEMNYWRNVPKNNTAIKSLHTLLVHHQNTIRDSAALAREVTVRAFEDLGASTKIPEFEDKYLPMVRQNGISYTNLFEILGQDYVRFAFDKIYALRPQVPVPTADFTQGIIKRLKANRDKTPAQRTAFLGTIWTEVADVAPGGVRGARVKPYDLEGRSAYERCFGGVGKACAGAEPALPKPQKIDKFMRWDGLQMTYVRMEAEVGSILHDNICHKNKGAGQACSGDVSLVLPELQQLALPVVGSLFKYLDPAAREWAKATYNVRDGRYWKQVFGPYPAADSVAKNWGDDLTHLVANRPSKVADLNPAIPFTGALPFLSIDYTEGEYPQTTLLFAPPGTELDVTDAAFCRSRTFAREQAVQFFTGWTSPVELAAGFCA